MTIWRRGTDRQAEHTIYMSIWTTFFCY